VNASVKVHFGDVVYSEYLEDYSMLYYMEEKMEEKLIMLAI
jgi:uncharacterized protein YlbG (UPF0298 family)